MNKCICEYNDWSICKTENGLEVHTEDGLKKVAEVFRVSADSCADYDKLNSMDFEKMAIEAGIQFDIAGELDDCSAFVFWKLRGTPSEDESDLETDLALAMEAFQHDVTGALNVPDFSVTISRATNIPDNELWINWEWSRLGKSDVQKFELPDRKITADTVTQVKAWMYKMIIVIINQR